MDAPLPFSITGSVPTFILLTQNVTGTGKQHILVLLF
jgi:hypothetical protein